MDKALLILGILLFIPAGIAGRKRPDIRRWIGRVVGFAAYPSASITFFYQASYRGYERGHELALIDLAVISLAISIPWTRWSSALRVPRWTYLFIAGASLLYAAEPRYTLFALHHILAVYFAFTVIAHAVEHEEIGPSVLQGLCFGVCYATYLALYQRYVGGYFQTPGPFGHQNGLALSGNMIFPAALALVMAGQGGKLAPLTVAAAALGTVLSLSRGGMVMYVGATGMVLAGSMLRGITTRKLVVVASLLGGTVLLAAKSLDSIVDRFTNAPEASSHAREEFERVAATMLHDHTFGVGLNHFSHASAMGYGDAAGLPAIDIGGIVHNVYWLQLAELGIIGLVGFVFLYFSPPLLGAITAIRDRGVLGDIALGLTAGIIVTLFQGKLEWSVFAGKLNRIIWVLFALLVGIYRQSRRRRQS